MSIGINVKDNKNVSSKIFSTDSVIGKKCKFTNCEFKKNCLFKKNCKFKNCKFDTKLKIY